jgi:hypothetical protein
MHAARSQRNGAASDASPPERSEVADRLEAQPHETVERPDVDVLEAIPRLRGLNRHQPGDWHLRNVAVVTVDIRVSVMRDVVPDAPRVAGEPEERVGSPSKQMVVTRLAEGCSVVRVVLNAEAGEYPTHCQPGE